jgi:hypothetical protein
MVDESNSTDPIWSEDEKIIREIFSKSRADLASADSQQFAVIVQNARHRAGFADVMTFFVRTGKIALNVLGLFFSAGERSGSGKER